TATDVAVLTGGQFVVLYQYGLDVSHTMNIALRIGINDTPGSPLGSEIPVANFFGNGFHESSMVALKDGGFLVAWTAAPDPLTSPILYGTRYAADVTVIGQQGFVIATGVANEEGTLGQLSLTSDGRVLVPYHLATGEIGEVIVDPRDNIIQ